MTIYGLFLNTYDYYKWNDLVCVSLSRDKLVEKCKDEKLSLLCGDDEQKSAEDDECPHYVIEKLEAV